MTPVQVARSHIGVRWAHQGRSSHALDCIGLLVTAFAEYGIIDFTDYGRDPSDGLLQSHVAAQFGPAIARADTRPGDIVLMAFPKAVRHVGIVGDHPDGLSLIHTDRSLGRVTEHRIDDRWMKCVRLVHRHPRDAGGAP